MRNLKRALSLGLTAAMISGLMVMGSSAASYADVTSEDNQEAIEVLQAVEIMVGDENGDFNPDQNVTRNEMAVIMSNLMEYNVASYKDTSPFTDVPSWAEPYVAACWTNGITAGTSATTYGGSDTVTTAQAALMLMKALGYFQYASDFGSDWQLATTRQGNAIDLFVGVDSGVTQAMTRNDVAQLVLNTLEAGTVEASTDGSWSIGDIVINNNVTYNYITSNQAYATAIDDARSTSNTTDANRSIVELGEQLYMGDLKLNDNRTDVFGRPARYWEYDGKEIGTYAKAELLKESYTTEVTGKDLYDLLGKSTIEDYALSVTIDGVSDEDILSDAYFDAADMNKNNKSKVGNTGNGVLTEVYVDIDEKTIDIAIINTYLAIADKDYDEKKDELDVTVFGLEKTGDEYVKVPDSCENDDDDSQGFTIAGEDFDVADLVEDDALLVTVAEGEVQSVILPEIVADSEITAFKLSSSVTVDGTKYSYADTAEYDFEVLDKYTGTGATNLKDVTYNVYLDQYGYAIGVDIVDAPDNYVFITGVDDDYSNLANKTLSASAIFIDGTMEVIEVKSDKGDQPEPDSGFSGATINKWYTYTVDNKGVYTLTEVPDDGFGDKDKVAQHKNADWDATDEPDATVIDKKNIALPGFEEADGQYDRVYGNDATVYLTASIKEIQTAANNSAIIIDAVDSVTTGVKNANITVWDSDDAEAKADKDTIGGENNLDDGVSSGVYTLYKSNGYIIAAVVVGEDSAASKNLVYAHTGSVEQEGYDKTADEWTWTRMVISNGEEVEIKEVGDALTYLNRMEKYHWYQVKYNADGEVISVEEADDALLGADVYVDDIDDLKAAMNEEDTVLYTQYFEGDHPEMKGSTLFVTTESTQGFFVAEDVNVVLIQTVKNKQETTFETSVKDLEDIINDLNAKYDEDGNAEYDYQVNAIIEDGAATSVIIYDKTNNYEKPETSVDNGISVNLDDPTNVTAVYTGEAPELDDILVAIEAALNDAGYTVVNKRMDNDDASVYVFEAKNNKTGFVVEYNYDSDAAVPGIGVQPSTPDEVKDIMNNSDPDKDQWHKLPSTGLTQTVKDGKLYLSGKLTAITADNWSNYKAAAEQWFGTGADSIADYEAFVTDIKGLVPESVEEDKIESIGYIMVKVYDADGGHNNFAAVIGMEDGTVLFAKQGTTSKDYRDVTIDITGLYF